MYELSVALKYLLPRWKQLSVSIISLISIVVISLVVWLIVVFFSVTHGLERSWIQKLVAVTAPIRLTPTQEYYNSYYYRIDSISGSSNYSSKSIADKLASNSEDPYDPEYDEEVPSDWPAPLLNSEGKAVDLVKEAFAAIDTVQGVAGLSSHDYELAYAEVYLQPAGAESPVVQGSYVSTWEQTNPALKHALMTPEATPDKASGSAEEAVLLPKSFKDAGIRVGDKGWLAYQAATTSALQEQRIPIVAAGFYDPGILPMGGKFILAPRTVTSTLRAVQTSENNYPTNGIGISFDDVLAADEIKLKVLQEIERRGLAPYWHVESYRDFPAAKDLLQQLHSERTLFTLIASIVIIVACSNIVSLLIILVNDKKEEIGILRAMGASVWSIAFIFGLCGSIMGAAGSFLGIGLALVTLSNLPFVVSFIGSLQGHELLNPLFYGDRLPTELSSEALFFVLCSTAFVSTIAGLIPALKACVMQPSQLLRTE